MQIHCYICRLPESPKTACTYFVVRGNFSRQHSSVGGSGSCTETIYTCISFLETYSIAIYIHTYVYQFLGICNTAIHMHTCICLLNLQYSYIHMYTCISFLNLQYRYIHTYIHTCISFTYTHTHIHTHR
jgi:hypothetical protein